jgi:hypothetical protein
MLANKTIEEEEAVAIEVKKISEAEAAPSASDYEYP